MHTSRWPAKWAHCICTDSYSHNVLWEKGYANLQVLYIYYCFGLCVCMRLLCLQACKTICMGLELSFWYSVLFYLGSSLCFSLFDYQSLAVYWFCKERQKHVGSDGSRGKENLRGLGGGETVIRTHYSIKYGMQKNHFLINKMGMKRKCEWKFNFYYLAHYIFGKIMIWVHV